MKIPQGKLKKVWLRLAIMASVFYAIAMVADETGFYRIRSIGVEGWLVMFPLIWIVWFGVRWIVMGFYDEPDKKGIDGDETVRLERKDMGDE